MIVRTRLASREGYVHRCLVAFDQAFNVVLFGLPDETLSSRCARLAVAGNPVGIAVIWFLDKIVPDHGTKAELSDLSRAQVIEGVEHTALKGDLNGTD